MAAGTGMQWADEAAVAHVHGAAAWYEGLTKGLPAPALGGRLLWAGLLDERGRALMVAGNVAGAATLAAAADAAMQRQAVRDGAADFLVTSLDEALRILKNEIRKGEPVAVCVGQEPAAVEREMAERGVAPDLLAGAADGLGARARQVEAAADGVWMAWAVREAPALWMPRLDALAEECLPAEAAAARRWLRRSPRYLGRAARGLRVVRCETAVAAAFAQRVRGAVASGAVGVAVELARGGDGGVVRTIVSTPGA